MKIYMTVGKDDGAVQIKLSEKLAREEVPVEQINTLREENFPDAKSYRFVSRLTGKEGEKLVIYDDQKDLTAIRTYRENRPTNTSTGSLATLGDAVGNKLAAAVN